MRPLRGTGRGTHRDSAFVSAGIVKTGMLGVLATATIAAPLASAAASPSNGLSADLAEAAGGSVPEGTSNAISVAAPAAEIAPAATVPATEVAPAEKPSVALPAADDATAAAEGSSDAAMAGTPAETPSVEVAPPVETTADGQQVSAPAATGDGSYMMPVDAPITSGYGWRIHPTLGYSKLHDGVDFGAACGTPVHAAQSGTVIAVESTSASGNRVIIEHADGVRTGYFHLSGFNTTVGATVQKGDVVGTVGSTGRSTGCHLHFSEITAGGDYMNPMSLYGE